MNLCSEMGDGIWEMGAPVYWFGVPPPPLGLPLALALALTRPVFGSWSQRVSSHRMRGLSRRVGAPQCSRNAKRGIRNPKPQTSTTPQTPKGSKRLHQLWRPSRAGFGAFGVLDLGFVSDFELRISVSLSQPTVSSSQDMRPDQCGESVKARRAVASARRRLRGKATHSCHRNLPGTSHSQRIRTPTTDSTPRGLRSAALLSRSRGEAPTQIRNLAYSSRNLALLHGQSRGSRARPAFTGFTSIYRRAFSS